MSDSHNSLASSRVVPEAPRSSSDSMSNPRVYVDLMLQRHIKAVAALQETTQKDPHLYEQVRYIVHHTRDFTSEQIEQVQSFAKSYPWFTQKQQTEIANPKKNEHKNPKRRQSGDDDHYTNADDCPDEMTQGDWDECCERQD